MKWEEGYRYLACDGRQRGFLDVSTTTTGRTPRLSGFARAVSLPPPAISRNELGAFSAKIARAALLNRAIAASPSSQPCRAWMCRFGPRNGPQPCPASRPESFRRTLRGRKRPRRRAPEEASEGGPRRRRRPHPRGKGAQRVEGRFVPRRALGWRRAATASATLPACRVSELCRARTATIAERPWVAGPESLPHVQAHTSDNLGGRGRAKSVSTGSGPDLVGELEKLGQEGVELTFQESLDAVFDRVALRSPTVVRQRARTGERRCD